MICHPPALLSAIFWQSRTGTRESGRASQLWLFGNIPKQSAIWSSCWMLSPPYSSLSLGSSKTVSNSWENWYEFGYHVIPYSCIIITENYSLLPNPAHSEHSECRQLYSAHFSLAILSKRQNLHLKLAFPDLWHNDRPQWGKACTPLVFHQDWIKRKITLSREYLWETLKSPEAVVTQT